MRYFFFIFHYLICNFFKLFEGVEDLDDEFDFVFDDEDSEEEENVQEIMMRMLNNEHI